LFFKYIFEQYQYLVEMYSVTCRDDEKWFWQLYFWFKVEPLFPYYVFGWPCLKN